MKRIEAFNEILGTEISGVWFDETAQCTVHSLLEQTAKAYKRTRSVRRDMQRSAIRKRILKEIL